MRRQEDFNYVEWTLNDLDITQRLDHIFYD